MADPTPFRSVEAGKRETGIFRLVEAEIADALGFC